MDDKAFREGLSRLPSRWSVIAYGGALLCGVGVAVRELTDTGTVLNDYARIAREVGGLLLLLWAILTLIWVRQRTAGSLAVVAQKFVRAAEANARRAVAERRQAMLCEGHFGRVHATQHLEPAQPGILVAGGEQKIGKRGGNRHLWVQVVVLAETLRQRPQGAHVMGSSANVRAESPELPGLNVWGDPEISQEHTGLERAAERINACDNARIERGLELLPHTGIV